MSRPAAADPQSSPSGRLVVAAPLEQQNEDGLARVSWPRTIWRLLLQPDAHPWSSRWQLRRRAPLVAVALAFLLLLLFAAGGCASAPPRSLRGAACAEGTKAGAAMRVRKVRAVMSVFMLRLHGCGPSSAGFGKEIFGMDVSDADYSSWPYWAMQARYA